MGVIQYYKQRDCKMRCKINDELDLVIGFTLANESEGGSLKDMIILKLAGKERKAFFLRIPHEKVKGHPPEGGT